MATCIVSGEPVRGIGSCKSGARSAESKSLTELSDGAAGQLFLNPTKGFGGELGAGIDGEHTRSGRVRDASLSR